MNKVVAPVYVVLKKDGTPVDLPYYGTTETGEFLLGTNVFGLVNFYPSTFSDPALEFFKKRVKAVFRDLRIKGVKQVTVKDKVDTYVILSDGSPNKMALQWQKIPRVSPNARGKEQ